MGHRPRCYGAQPACSPLLQPTALGPGTPTMPPPSTPGPSRGGAVGPLACFIRVIGEAAVQLSVADASRGEAAAAGAAKLGGGAGGGGAAVLVGAVGAVGHAVAAGAPGQALPAGAAVLVRGAARGADFIRAVPAVLLVVTDPGARHATPVSAAGELPLGATRLGRARLRRGRAMPPTRGARAAGMGTAQPWGAPHHPGVTVPVARLLAGAGWLCQPGAAPGGETHQFLQPCCTVAPAGKAKPSQKHGHSAGSMQPPSASGEGRRCQPYASPISAPHRPHSIPTPSPCQLHTIPTPAPRRRQVSPCRTLPGGQKQPSRQDRPWQCSGGSRPRLRQVGGQGGPQALYSSPPSHCRAADKVSGRAGGRDPPPPHSHLVPLPPHAGGS